jgi:hypothetical protein
MSSDRRRRRTATRGFVARRIAIMWGSKKKPQRSPVALSQRAEPAVRSQPPAVQRQLRAKSELINGMVDHLPEVDRIIALCDGGPGVFGQTGAARYGVYVLTSRERLWRNSDWSTLGVVKGSLTGVQILRLDPFALVTGWLPPAVRIAGSDSGPLGHLRPLPATGVTEPHRRKRRPVRKRSLHWDLRTVTVVPRFVRVGAG